ncbi:dihydroxyacetone kinase subunit DhaK, partial [Rhizobiaceae sp. 2RAB30]
MTAAPRTNHRNALIAASGGRLVRFGRESHAGVVLRSDWDKSKVAVVSGGGSGHEPSHAGQVGKGLLTAAVCGEVFASPSVDAVLSTIVAVTGPMGCLLVVKNYTGDRLNFGLAAEKAKALGLDVEMVIVADDVAIPDAPQPRGVAGTVFIHKIAGHLSEAGKSLGEIVEAVDMAKAGLATIGVARDTCTVPGSPKHERIGPDEVEIGLGIHGEAGVELARPTSSGELMASLVARLEPHLEPDASYAVLFNNLGGLSGLECSVLVSDLMKSNLAARMKYLAGPAGVMTALDMPGFSISFLKLTPDIETILQSPTACPALPPFQPVGKVVVVAAPAIAEATRPVPSSNDRVRRVVEIVIETCIAMESDIDALDAKVGDGDTGSTFATAARAVGRSLDDLP